MEKKLAGLQQAYLEGMVLHMLTIYSSILNYKAVLFSKPHFTVALNCLHAWVWVLGRTEQTPLHCRGPVVINRM